MTNVQSFAFEFWSLGFYAVQRGLEFKALNRRLCENHSKSPQIHSKLRPEEIFEIKKFDLFDANFLQSRLPFQTIDKLFASFLFFFFFEKQPLKESVMFQRKLTEFKFSIGNSVFEEAKKANRQQHRKQNRFRIIESLCGPRSFAWKIS